MGGTVYIDKSALMFQKSQKKVTIPLDKRKQVVDAKIDIIDEDELSSVITKFVEKIKSSI